MEAIERFLEFNVPQMGHGFGDGSGYGSGYATGGGSNYCSGYGCGDGYGSGGDFGSGFGYNYNFDGDGSGVAVGFGTIVCSGYGYGDTIDIVSFNNEPVYTLDDVPTIIRQLHNNVGKGVILKSDLTLVPCYIMRNGNYFAHGRTLRLAQQDLYSKMFSDLDVEERISFFLEEFTLGQVYPTEEFFEWHHKLTGSCEMGRNQFALDHGVDLDGTMTVEEFIVLTKDAYGGEVIQKLAARLGL